MTLLAVVGVLLLMLLLTTAWRILDAVRFVECAACMARDAEAHHPSREAPHAGR